MLLCLPANAWSQAPGDEEWYTAACAACHGGDGAGRSIEDVGFDTPLPDFTDCEFASREPDPDWHAVIHRGGPVRAFDRMMPAFGTALDSDEIGRHPPPCPAADQVQIYEPIIGDSNGNVTTALLRGVRYLKDNRLLPEGFDKGAAASDVAVQGAAADDADFTGGGDRVRYRIDAGEGVTSVTVTARLLLQTIGYRWARNLANYDAFETNRFVDYYEANAEGSVMTLAVSSAEGRR